MTTRCRRLGVRPGCGPRAAGCSAISGRAGRRRAAGWSASHAVFPRASNPTRCPLSSPTCAPTGTRRWPWRCWWAGCEQPRFAPCAWLTWTGGCAGSGSIGKGNKERTVPVDRVFFTELGNYLRTERPPGCATPECFVVLRGPTRGSALTEAGMRRIFRTHRARSGSTRVRPHRLRHTYGTELATAGIDLLVLRELMGHASPESTAAYVHLSSDTLAAEFAKARAATR